MQTLDGFRLSPQQRHLWLLQQGVQPLPYWAQGAIQIEGRLDRAALAAALQQIVDQHEILRTTFHRLPGMPLPMQVIAESAAPTWREEDLRDVLADEQSARVDVLLREQREQPIDLSRGPLLRLTLLALSPSSHVLLVGLPALCADAAAIANLARAIGQAYAAHAPDAAPDDEVMQYADVSEILNELLESEESDVGRSYWRRQDLAELGPASLPYEQPSRPAGFAPRQLALTLPPDQVAQIDALAQRHGCPPEQFLLACWQALLGRLGGQPALAVGLAYDGRTYQGMEDALGLFAKYVPVRAQLDEAQPFRDLLEHVRQAVDEAYEFQEYFSWEELAGGPQPSPGPALFCFDALERPAPYAANGVTFALSRWYACVDHFLARLSCVRDADALRLEFHYASNALREADISRLAEEFTTLVASAAADPAAPLGALDALGAAERRQLLVEFNQTATAFPQDVCLHELFEAQVARTPNAIAVVFDDRPTTNDQRPTPEVAPSSIVYRLSSQVQRLTYRELDTQANQLAHELRALGVGPEVPVGLCAERSLDMVVGLLGILKAGGAYLPIDPAYPAERIAFMLEDSGAAVVLTIDSGSETGRGGDKERDALLVSPSPPLLVSRQVVDLRRDWPRIAQRPAEPLDSGVSAGNMAYVIYTSGSTGAPKGVVVQHRSVVNLASALHQAIYAHGPADPRRVSLNGPLVFDTSVKQLIQLLAGHTLYVLPMEIRFDRAALLAYLREHRIDVFDCTPSQLKLLLADGRLERLGGGHTDVLVGGEGIDAALWRVLAQAEDSTIYNVYGPTECTVDATIGRLDPADPQPTIGRPIANVQTYVLDRALGPVPIGVVGELYIGGAGLARGYLGRPDLTAARFIPNPFVEVSGAGYGVSEDSAPNTRYPAPGTRLYKTGDLARYRPDGAIEFLGRADDQVKIRGFRVELGEIAAVLQGHPALQEAVVTLREDVPGERRLVAYAVPDQQRAFTVRQLLRLERSGALADEARYELPNDMIVAHLNKNETTFLYREIFEDRTYLQHGVTLRDGDCVFDVGANIGMFSLFAAHACKDVTIYAFEPIPPLFELLRTNTALYDIRARLFQCGLADESRSDVFTYYPHASTMSGRYVDPEEERAVIKSLVLNQQEAGPDAPPLSEELLDTVIAERLTSEQFTCQLKTISEVIREQGVERIDLLKIDAQKSELEVLNGIQEGDWPKIRQIVLEVHDIDGRLAQTLALLERHGYSVAVEQETAMRDTPLYDVYAVRPERDLAAPTNGAEPHLATPPAWRNPNLLVADLRSYAQAQLPDYMVPAVFVLLEALPLTPNGKLDRKALPAPEPQRPDRERSYVAPRTPAEAVLARIWADVLRQKRVGVNDNFFALGGDSILGIQVVARATQAGLHLVPHQIFSHQTIAELATVAGAPSGMPGRRAEQGLVLGTLPLTPIQHWFFELDLPDPRAWTQAIVLETRRVLDPEMFAQVMRHVLLHHDALRLRFVQEEGAWRQQIVEPPADTPFTAVSLADVPAAEREEALQRVVSTLEAQLDLAEGLLLRAALIDRGADQPDVLLLVTHALAVDGFSRRILAEDLQSAYEQLRRGEAVQLPAKTTSLKQWAERLAEYAQSAALRREQDEWLDQPWGDVVRLPVDDPSGANSLASARTVVTTLSAEETRALLQEVPAAYQTQINDVLLTALVQAFAPWLGADRLLIDLRGHGRETIFDDVDLSRTVGWFTTVFPVLLDLGGATQPGEALKTIKEQLRRIPNRGLGYGVLRYLSPDADARAYLRALPQAQVSFNYLGQFDQVLSEESLFAVSQERSDPSSGLWGTRYLLEVQGGIIGDQLSLAWKYSSQIHHPETIERLAGGFLEALRSLIAHCRSAEAGGYTPSDFPLANLNQQALDAILSRVRKAQG